ncbi:MAG: TolC family protein [Bacteroidetes bacterium]|nr:TolC family protein [Bacteroidota bacterium]MBI3481917.1 TolC family protein [Bacteroidota bacterium]
MKRLLVTILLGLSLILGVRAQTKTLTFNDAVKIALRNGVLFNQQKNNLELNQIQKLSNILGLGPTLAASTSAYRVDGNTFNNNTGQVVNGIFDQMNVQINANWNIFNGFSQVNRAKQYSNLLDAQAFYINRTAQDLINTITGQYLQVLLDAELLKIANENWEALKNQLRQVKEQVELGARSPVDEYNQDSQTKAAEIRALQAQINLINDKALLTQTLLLDPTEDLEIVKPDWDINSVFAGKTEFKELFETALKSRGDYLRAVKNEDAARFGMNAARSTMLPTLSAFGTLYSAYNHAHGDPNVRPFDVQFKSDNLKKIYGLQLNIPILGGNQNLQNRTNYVQQRVTYLNNQLTRKNVEVQVKTDVLRAHQNMQLYAKTYTVTIDQLKAAEVALQLESERYNLGVTNFVDYANANRVFVQAQTDKAQAEYRLLFQKVLVDYAVGTLKPEDFQ